MTDTIDKLVEDFCESVQFQKVGGEVFTDTASSEGDNEDE